MVNKKLPSLILSLTQIQSILIQLLYKPLCLSNIYLAILNPKLPRKIMYRSLITHPYVSNRVSIWTRPVEGTTQLDSLGFKIP